MGKTGTGKSSLCNALFQGEVTSVSDVNTCTREVLRLRLSSGDHNLILVALPGVGESEQRDQEYEFLYRYILPELDLILWVIKADDLAFSVDERFYRRVMSDHHQRVLFVVIRDNPAKNVYEDELFSIRYYQKGTAHLTFKCLELIKRMNDIIAKHYPGMLAAR
nr:DUF4942 domain-containing protein [Rosenbergiella collisarenosi]